MIHLLVDGDSENKKGTCKQQLFGTQGGTQNNMDELMGLCSGKFGERLVSCHRLDDRTCNKEVR